MTPIILLGLLVNGPLFFFKYATQWGIFTTVGCFILIWWTAELEIKLGNLRLQDPAINPDPNSYTEFKFT